MHGLLTQIRCIDCGKTHQTENDTNVQSVCPHCNGAGDLRPDIVWFGEVPYRMPQITAALEDVDLFIAIGTSGTVYPAAGFCELARLHGGRTIEINLMPSANANTFDDGLYGPASIKVPEFVQTIMKEIGIIL